MRQDDKSFSIDFIAVEALLSIHKKQLKHAVQVFREAICVDCDRYSEECDRHACISAMKICHILKGELVTLHIERN